MFWKRVLTAVLLIPPLLAALWFLPPVPIAMLFGVAILLAALELSRLLPIASTGGRAVYVFVILVLGAAGSVAALYGLPGVVGTLAAATVWWSYLCLHYLFSREPLGGVFASTAGKLTTGVVVLAPAWVSFVFLFVRDSSSPLLLVYLLVLIWVADSAAYLVGRSIGRHKLAPLVSPGRTIEGAVGALLASALVATAAGWWLWHFRGSMLLAWIVLGLVTAAVSIVGDLTESTFKRIAGVKDSGALLPGHGGMFDRIDALTAAGPVFGLGWLLLQKVAQ